MATEFVNKHITRVMLAGGTVADASRLAAADAWLSAQGYSANLIDWTNPAFGVIKNGSDQISKLMGLGSTWLPRLGDLTPNVPASTIYSATGMGGLPAWSNTGANAYSYYGAARGGTIRADNIRRKHRQGLTVFAVYKKNNTTLASLIGQGQFNAGRIVLQNTAGSPGSCKAFVGATAFSATHQTTLANNAIHIIGFTFDGDTLTTYVEDVAGTGAGIATGYVATYSNSNKAQYRPLLGAANLNNQHYYSLVHGSQDSFNNNTQTSTSRSVGAGNNDAIMTVSDLIMLDTNASQAAITSLVSLLRGWYGS